MLKQRHLGPAPGAHLGPHEAHGPVRGRATGLDAVTARIAPTLRSAQVRGAGHMAPLYQPLRLYSLFTRFLRGEAP